MLLVDFLGENMLIPEHIEGHCDNTLKKMHYISKQWKSSCFFQTSVWLERHTFCYSLVLSLVLVDSSALSTKITFSIFKIKINKNIQEF